MGEKNKIVNPSAMVLIWQKTRTAGRPMSLVSSQTEIKHDIRVDSCRRTSLLLMIPATECQTLR